MRALQAVGVLNILTPIMHLFFLITGIVLFPKVYTLTCNTCRTSKPPCAGGETQCPAESTQCMTLRRMTFEGNTERFDRTTGSCSKVEHCTNSSFNAGVISYFFTIKCCATDKCNTELPADPIRKPSPNGLKCYHCDGSSGCTGTLNCDGDQTYCATVGEGEMGITKGCATKTMCVNPSPNALVLNCCQGNYCNGNTRTTASLLLLTTMLLSLFFFSN